MNMTDTEKFLQCDKMQVKFYAVKNESGLVTYYDSNAQKIDRPDGDYNALEFECTAIAKLLVCCTQIADDIGSMLIEAFPDNDIYKIVNTGDCDYLMFT